MIKRLLSFLDASPVNFLAVKNISEELEKNGFRRMNPQEPLGKIEAGEKFFVTRRLFHLRLPNRKEAFGRCRFPHDLCPLRFAYLPHQAKC